MFPRITSGFSGTTLGKRRASAAYVAHVKPTPRPDIIVSAFQLWYASMATRKMEFCRRLDRHFKQGLVAGGSWPPGDKVRLFGSSTSVGPGCQKYIHTVIGPYSKELTQINLLEYIYFPILLCHFDR